MVGRTDPEQYRKLFIGGLDFRTTDDTLRSYFEKWGEIVDVVVMKDNKTKRSKGFGFITYSEEEMVDASQAERPHKIDGRSVETKRAIPREESGKPEANVTVKKLFVGGIKDEMTEEEVRDHFMQYGEVLSVSLVTEKGTDKKRGFGFIEFDDYDAVDKCILKKSEHRVRNRPLDVKKALSKQQMQDIQNKQASKQNYDYGGDRGGDYGGRGGDYGGRGGDYGGNRGGDSWNRGDNGGYGGGYNRSGGGGGGGGSRGPWGGDTGAWGNPGNQQGNWGGGQSSWGGPGNWGGQGNWDSQGGYGGGGGSSWGPGGGGGSGGGFGSGYQQGYSGGPMRGGGQRPGPYSQGGGRGGRY